MSSINNLIWYSVEASKPVRVPELKSEAIAHVMPVFPSGAVLRVGDCETVGVKLVGSVPRLTESVNCQLLVVIDS